MSQLQMVAVGDRVAWATHRGRLVSGIVEEYCPARDTWAIVRVETAERGSGYRPGNKSYVPVEMLSRM